MRLFYEEFTANIDEDFKAVIEKLQNTFCVQTRTVYETISRVRHDLDGVARTEPACFPTTT